MHSGRHPRREGAPFRDPPTPVFPRPSGPARPKQAVSLLTDSGPGPTPRSSSPSWARCKRAVLCPGYNQEWSGLAWGAVQAAVGAQTRRQTQPRVQQRLPEEMTSTLHAQTKFLILCPEPTPLTVFPHSSLSPTSSPLSGPTVLPVVQAKTLYLSPVLFLSSTAVRHLSLMESYLLRLQRGS